MSASVQPPERLAASLATPQAPGEADTAVCPSDRVSGLLTRSSLEIEVLDVVRSSRPTTAEMPDAILLGSSGATDADHPIAPDGSRYFTRFVCKARSKTPPG